MKKNLEKGFEGIIIIFLAISIIITLFGKTTVEAKTKTIEGTRIMNLTQNIKGKEYLKSLEKYYIVDIGMRYMLLGSKMMDTGHILENVVYLELFRRGYDVYVGKIDNYEVNFVAQNHKGTIYYQVALTVRDEKTLQRELRPLQAIRDHYPKVILTMDEDPEIQYDGIRRINARDWLLGLTD